MEIKYSRDAMKFLAKLDYKSVKRIRTAISGLARTPPEGDIKRLKGYSDGRQRLRVGGWRIIYRYDLANKLEILFIIGIGNRGDVYK